MCIRSSPVGKVSYHDSEAPRRRRHAYSGISTLDFSLVFVVVRCLVFVSSSALRAIVVFGVFSFVRVRCSLVVFGRAISAFVVRTFYLYRSYSCDV